MNWLQWFGHMIWQPRHDQRVDRVQAEVDDIKQDVTRLKDQVRALQAFHDLAEDSER